MTGHNTHVYIDDIIIQGINLMDNIDNFERVFLRVQESKLKVNLKKYTFFKTSVKYLGHIRRLHVWPNLGGSKKGEPLSHTALQREVKPSGRSLSGGRSIQFNPKHWESLGESRALKFSFLP